MSVGPLSAAADLGELALEEIDPTYPKGVKRRKGEGDQVRRRTIRGMAFMTGSSAGQAILQLVFIAILSHVIAPKQFGLVAGALIAVNLTTVLAESGMGAAIVQRATLTRQHIRVAWTLSVILGVTAWGVLALLAPQIQELLRLPGLAPILRVIALAFVINSLTLSDYMLSRRLQFGKLASAELTSYAFGYGAVAVTLAYLGYGPWAIVWGQVCQSAMRTVLVTVMAPLPVRPSFARKPLKELANFGGGYSIGRIALWAATQMDNFVVGRYLGPAALGLYGRAYQLVQMPANLFGQVANEVLFPAMAARQNNQAVLRRVYRLAVSFLAVLALPSAVLAAITSRPLVLVLLGPSWLPLRAAFDVIIFGLLFRTMSNLTDALMKAKGAVYARGWRSVIFALMVFTGAYTGKSSGLHGVAIGVLIALSINYLITNQLCISLVGTTWLDFAKAHVPAIILSATVAAVGLAMQQLANVAHLDAPLRLATIWAAGIAAALLVVRIAWRTRILGSISMMVATLYGMLSGKLARVTARLLGPGYAPLLQQERQATRDAKPPAQPTMSQS